MAQAVSCWSVTAEAQVQSQASPDGGFVVHSMALRQVFLGVL